jgi:hypothetical protein
METVRPSTEERRRQLGVLQEALREVLPIVRLHSSRTWVGFFGDCLERTTRLLSDGFDQEDLTELAVYVTGPFTPKDADILGWHWTVDASSGRCSILPGTEAYEEIARRIHEAAFALRTIGERP